MTMPDFIPSAESLTSHPSDDVERDDFRETIWENPLAQDVTLHLHVGTKWGVPPKNEEQRTGVRRLLIKGKSRRAVSSEFDKAIQHTECADPSCSFPKHKCEDRTHRRTIIGGLGPQLINVGAQVRPRLHPSLDTLQVEKRQAEERALEALREADRAKERQRIAEGDLLLARQEEEKRAKTLADREAALAERERKLAEAEAAAARKK